ncbi:MAG: site-2 protease family protein [Gemmatimonadota bacterium]|nr:site-2 protease family protein [Gemmatimonadota bacterium]
MTDWFDLFVVYRTVAVRDDEIVQGILRPDLSPGHPLVRSTLDEWGGTHFIRPMDAGTEITLMRPIGERPRERWWIHILLGLLALLTTTASGAYLSGRDPFHLAWFGWGWLGLPLPVTFLPGELLPGLAFSLPLLGILFGHEMGHYLVARRNGMSVSPPYFIPAPQWINLIGTFGAFIRLRSVVINRRVLLDVGMAGPIVSFLLSIPVAVIGLAMSSTMMVTLPGAPHGRFAVLFAGQEIWLGNSLLFGLLDRIIAGEGTFLLLHPVAFAAWMGFFVTALNLFPLSQLDGGHILYALLGNRQRVIGIVFLVVLLGLGFSWPGWWLWAGLILALGRGSVRHPSVFDPALPVTGRRRTLGWLCVIIFFLTFMPVPIRF